MKTFFTALRLFVALSIVTGGIYPLVVTGIGKIFFPHKSAGSLIVKDGTVVGSELIGQEFKDASFFWSRPSAHGYDATRSGGSNLGPISKELKTQVDNRRDVFARAPGSCAECSVPGDLVFASASGLDPHIGPEAAKYQAGRIAAARGFSGDQIKKLDKMIDDMIEDRMFGILGDKRINVLKLNMELERIFAR